MSSWQSRQHALKVDRQRVRFAQRLDHFRRAWQSPVSAIGSQARLTFDEGKCVARGEVDSQHTHALQLGQELEPLSNAPFLQGNDS